MENRIVKILAIDDNKDNLTIMKALIMEAFPKTIVLTAFSGQQGLEIAEKEEPDVILLDIIMPGMDGFEVCRKLKSDKLLRDIPVVFVTAIKSDKASRIKALESGAEAFLTKPIDESELTAQIRAMLKIREANIEKRDEKQLLEVLVEEKTKELRDSNEELIQLVEVVKRDQALMQSIFDSIPGYLYVYDESGRLIKWNKKHETMTGYTETELSHMTLEKWFDQEDIVKVNAAVQDIFEKGYGEVEAQLILKNGEKMMTRSSGAPLIMNGHKYFAGIGVDITERKQVEEALHKSEERFRVAQEVSPDGFSILHPERNETVEIIDFTFVYENQAIARLNQTDPQNVIGKRLLDLFPDHRETSVFKAYMDVANTRNSHIMEEIYVGEILSVPTWLRLVIVSMGEDIAILAQDITNQKKAEKELLESEERYRYLFENSGVGIGYYTTDGIVISYNKKSLENIGGKPEDYIGKSIRVLFPKEEAEKYLARIEKTISSDKPQEYEDRVAFNSCPKWFLSTYTKVMDTAGAIIGVQIASMEITNRKQAESDLLYLSCHDHLTDLYNRRYFEEEIKRLDVKGNLPLSIIMIDTNGLKITNDSFGHHMGDELLKKAACAIKQACRTEDLIVRYGGDEFVVVLPNTNTDETLKIATFIKEIASKEWVANIELSISYGYDTKQSTNESIMEILANAENHMYRNKLSERSSMRSKQIEIIMNTLFEKSNRESQHSIRVSNICKAIAVKMKFENQKINQVGVAGLVHDIGKIGTDEKILNKNGKLDSDEWNKIQKHPEAGWRILSSSNEFAELAQFVLSHHERWDGNGYPNKLKGENIPLEARIITVADAYDAMTCERSYRKALDKDIAIEELKRCSGTQFDPKIIDVFVNQVLTADNDFN